MNRLEAALRRLYGWPAATADIPLRVVTITVRRSRDWPRVAELLRVLQEELQLPAPAVSVAATSGFTVWLALAEGTDPAMAGAFVLALRQRALADLPDGDLALEVCPRSLPPMPAEDDATGRWSAFIDPGMGSLFVDEAGLDFQPPIDRQADLLAGLACIDAEALARALAECQPPAALPGAAAAVAAAAVTAASAGSLLGPFPGPRDFLLAVMNDASTPLALRIEAAKALLVAGEGR